MTKDKLKGILFQLRREPEKLALELVDFARWGGLDEQQLDTVNLYDEYDFDTDSLLSEYHFVLFGGSSGEGDVLLRATLPEFVKKGAEVMDAAYRKSVPLFASCFGFQLAARHFGGKLEKKEEYYEMGSYPLFVTNEGQTDTVFGKAQNPFHAISGHEKSAVELPEEAVLLAYSELCPHHAFRMGNSNFYATQFHPELDREAYIKAITIYKHVYFKTEEEYNTAVSGVHDTSDANALIGNFIENVVLKKYE